MKNVSRGFIVFVGCILVMTLGCGEDSKFSNSSNLSAMHMNSDLASMNEISTNRNSEASFSQNVTPIHWDGCDNETGDACPARGARYVCPRGALVIGVVQYEGVDTSSDATDGIGILCAFGNSGRVVEYHWSGYDSETGSSYPPAASYYTCPYRQVVIGVVSYEGVRGNSDAVDNIGVLCGGYQGQVTGLHWNVSDSETGSQPNYYVCPRGQMVAGVAAFEGTRRDSDAVDNLGILCVGF